MGYPMTMQRILNRNGLAGKGYGDKPSGYSNAEPWTRETLDGFLPDVDRIDVLLNHQERLCKALNAAYSAWGLIAGDLQRLVNDSADEGAIAAYIANRTGIDRETVAVVLKEWAQW